MTPTELADIFDQWATEADEQFRRAFDNDEIGKAARLRGKAQGLSMAAFEIRRTLTSPPAWKLTAGTLNADTIVNGSIKWTP